MPNNLIGKTKGDVQEILSSQGLSVRNITEPNESVPKGTVFKTDPAEGATMYSGDTITVYIAGAEAVNTTEVPDLVGKNKSEYLAILSERQLSGDTITTVDSDLPTGQIISQDPVAGTIVQPNSYVNIVVSSGTPPPPPQVQVPDLVGLNEESIEVVLENVELIVGEVEEIDSKEPEGTVLSQNPMAGELADVKSGVNVVISTGVDPEKAVTIPDIRGLQESQVAGTLAGLELVLGSISYSSDSKPAGTVIGQSLAAGTQVSKGTIINITVSTGAPVPTPPATTTVPNVMGHSQASAESAIAGAGITASSSKVVSDAPMGQVVGQSPAAGTVVAKGSSVSLSISDGSLIEDGGDSSSGAAVLNIMFPKWLKTFFGD